MTKTEQAHRAGKHETNPSRLCWEVARIAQSKISEKEPVQAEEAAIELRK